jgi:class 3 adenylate cyclase
VALAIFERIGAAPWAEIAHAELRGTGETARRRDPSTLDDLTAQELTVSRLLADGMTTREAASALFLSPKTIEYHLRNVYRKLGIASRQELAVAIGRAEPTQPQRILATIVFTDIVASTERAALLGDRAWRTLLVQHREVVRGHMERFGGHEIDTAGDGFLVLFEGPGRAIGFAQSVIPAVRELGLDLRVAVHTGEVERFGPNVSGIAVHIAARICSLAGPSEILVSSTVRDLTTGSDLAFDDAGEHAIKGVPQAWHVYRLSPAGVAGRP